ncbi:MAG: NUMOD4 motif-containing HNH endonuclease [Candidatus Thorarchaeota archaeon]
MIEKWEYIKGFEDSYQTSNMGNVKSLRRKGRKKEMILKPQEHSDGRTNVTLYKNGKKHNKKVHRLVAEAFIPNPKNKPQVDHKNGKKADNRASNLRWVTNKENKYYQKLLNQKKKNARNQNSNKKSK